MMRPFLHTRIAAAALAAGALAAPFAIYPVFLMHGLVMALFAAAFNLLFGYAGLLSFGHAAFFGAGAYVTAFLMKGAGVGAETAIVASALVATVLGAAMGTLAVRRRGIYFAMVTLALAEVVYFLVLRVPATGGEDGLQGIPRGSLFGVIDLNSTFHLYYVVLAVVAIALLFLHRVIHSPFGMVLRGIRDNEQRAISLGYSVQRHLLLAMVLSAALAGLAGGVKALVFQFAALSDVSWHMSGLVVLACLIGGVGTFAGPIVGGIVLVMLQSMLAESGEWATLILGVAFIACVHLFRDGIAGSLQRALTARVSVVVHEEGRSPQVADPLVGDHTQRVSGGR